jgi:hypothetical protein
VTERIWHVARRLTQLRRESLLWGAPVRDAHYNLLRFIELPDLILDDRWDDYGIIRPAALHHDDHPIPDDLLDDPATPSQTMPSADQSSRL